MKYRATFNGCTRGAIGIHYPISTTVEGEDEQAATLALYERYDHITTLRLVPIKEEKEA